MDQGEDVRELERKIEQASRIVSAVTDQTTYQRLTAWIDELRQKLQNRLAARRFKEEIRVRAHELGSSTAARRGGNRRNRNLKTVGASKGPYPLIVRD